MMKDAGARISCLITSPHPRVPGGVSAFVETMKRHFHITEYRSIWVGRVPGEAESWVRALFRVLYVPLQVFGAIRSGKFDVVHLNPSLDEKSMVRDGLILWAALTAGRAKTLVFFHGWRPDTERRIRHNPLARGIFRMLLRRSGGVLVLAPEFRDALIGLNIQGEKIHLATTMFDGADLHAAEPGSLPTRRFILFMSRFEVAKGPMELLEGFADIAASFEDVDLVLAGDGPMRLQLERRAQELGLGARVVFPGYVRGADKARMLLACTVYALPSYSEGMPVGILEAMGAGKPIIAACVGGIPSIVQDPENGLLIKPRDAAELENALRRLLSDGQLCRDMGRNNAEIAWRKYEAATVTAEIERTYQSILDSAGKRPWRS